MSICAMWRKERKKRLVGSVIIIQYRLQRKKPKKKKTKGDETKILIKLAFDRRELNFRFTDTVNPWTASS